MGTERDIRSNIERGKYWDWVRQVGFPIAVLNDTLCEFEESFQNPNFRPDTEYGNFGFTLASLSTGLQATRLADKGRKVLEGYIHETEKREASLILKSPNRGIILPGIDLPIIHPIIDAKLDFATAATYQEGLEKIIEIARNTGDRICGEYLNNFLRNLPHLNNGGSTLK